MGLSKGLRDYLTVSQMLTGNKRKGIQRIKEIAAESEKTFVEILNVLTFGACEGMETVAQVAASDSAAQAIAKSSTANGFVMAAGHMPKFFGSSAYMAALVEDESAMSSLAESDDLAAAIGTSVALSEITGSSIAMTAMMASANARSKLFASDAAVTAMAGASASLDAIAASSDASLTAYGKDALYQKLKNNSQFAANVAPTYVSKFASLSWAEVGKLSPLAQANKSAFAGCVGKGKSVSIENYSSHTFSVIGVGTDAGSGFTFCCDDIVANRSMNSSGTTIGGWESSGMRSWLSGTLLKALPTDLQAAIKAVTKKNTANYGSATTSDKLWLPSFTEVGLDSGTTEGSKYPAFTDNNSRIRKNNGSAGSWWLRSVASSGYFRGVDSGGSLSYSVASYGGGVVPCFCI